MRLGVDLDGVVAKFFPAYYELFNKMNHTNHDWKELKEHNIPKHLGISQEEFDECLYLMSTNRDFANLEIMEGAQEALYDLKHNGHEINFITARFSGSDTMDWIHQSGIPYDNVYFSKNKAGLVKAAGIEVMVDDFPVHLENIAKNKLETKKILFDQPWNREYKIPNEMQRAHNWQECHEIISDLTTSENTSVEKEPFKEISEREWDSILLDGIKQNRSKIIYLQDEILKAQELYSEKEREKLYPEVSLKFWKNGTEFKYVATDKACGFNRGKD